MHRERLLELLLKRRSGIITLPEQTELARIIEENNCRAFLPEIEEIFEAPLNFNGAVSERAVNESIERLHAKTGLTRSEKKTARVHRAVYNRIIAVAASLIFFVITGYFLFRDNRGVTAPPENVIAATTKKGSKTNVVLPDGTKVWINADSRLSYNKSFGKYTREVYLQGEAYFDVVKDVKKPFVVHTHDMDVRVLGTTFNVKAYPENDNSEATLIKGIVEVTLKKDSMKKIVLKPNEKLSVFEKTGRTDIGQRSTPGDEKPHILVTNTITPINDSVVMEVQWTKNRLVFNNMKLGDVVKELSRWYNINVTVTDEFLKNTEYSGTFEDESIQQVIEALKLTGGFQYKIDKNSVTITP